MKYEWIIEQNEVDNLLKFMNQWEQSALVKERIDRNVRRRTPNLSHGNLWAVHIACLLTSQQRSGPTSPVSQLLSKVPFPLELQRCAEQEDFTAHVGSVLKTQGGIRFTTKLPRLFETNLSCFCGTRAVELQSKLLALKDDPSIAQERGVARYLAGCVAGFGPKQARNFLQILGLSRWVVPLDSRFIKWLKRFDFPVAPSSFALSDDGYYEFVEDGVVELCSRAGIFPCVLDAAMFASFDTEEWTPEMALW